MKLASALAERADIQRRLQEMETRLHNNARVQEGDEPAEDPKLLLEESESLLQRLEELIYRINLTNSKTDCGGLSLTCLLAKRDCMKEKLLLLRRFLDTASNKTQRQTRTEIRLMSTINVAEMQKKVDALAKELRELDEKIQEANWTTELC